MLPLSSGTRISTKYTLCPKAVSVPVRQVASTLLEYLSAAMRLPLCLPGLTTLAGCFLMGKYGEVKVTPVEGIPATQKPDTCKRGHDLTDAPVRNGSRHCQECSNLRNAEYKQRNANIMVEVPCPVCGVSRSVHKNTAYKARDNPCRSCTIKSMTGRPSPLKGTGGKPCAYCGAWMIDSARLIHCSHACRVASGQYEQMAKVFRERRGEVIQTGSMDV